jgi:hypothetical protein
MRCAMPVRMLLKAIAYLQEPLGITRPMSRIEHLSYYPLLCERLRTLAQAG